MPKSPLSSDHQLSLNNSNCRMTSQGQKLIEGWHTLRPEADLAVIFVHGLFSAPTTCWGDTEKGNWPTLLANDPMAPPASIFLGQYFTQIGARDYSVQDCAKQLFASLRRQHGSEKISPLSMPNIVFVAHSLGGIVTRRLLIDNEAHFRNKRVGLCLMGSPSMGSAYATALGLVATIWRNKTAQQLRGSSEFLSDLDTRFNNFIESRPTGTFFGTEALENLPPLSFRFLPQLFPKIVADSSAGRYFGRRAKMHGTTHSTLVKPTARDHPSHLHLLDFLNDHFPETKTLTTATTTPHARPGEVLFEVYETRHEDRYVARDFDSRLRTIMDVRSVWVYGSTGHGKTCALRRLALQHGGVSITVCFSQHSIPPDRQTSIREAFETLAQMGHAEPTPAPTFNQLINALCKIASQNQDVVLSFDEIPVPSNAENKHPVLDLAHDLLSNAAGRGFRLRIIASSLIAPSNPPCPRSAKFNELMEVAFAEPWSPGESAQLIERIERELLELRLDAGDREHLIQSANGSPRFIKMFYKSKWTRKNLMPSFSEILAETKEQLAC